MAQILTRHSSALYAIYEKVDMLLPGAPCSIRSKDVSLPRRPKGRNPAMTI